MGIEDSWRNVVRTFIRLGIAQQKHFSSSTMQIAHCTLYFAHCSLNILLYTLLQIAAHCRLQHIAYCTSHIASVGCRFETASQCITGPIKSSWSISGLCAVLINQKCLIFWSCWKRAMCQNDCKEIFCGLQELSPINKCFESEIFWWKKSKEKISEQRLIPIQGAACPLKKDAESLLDLCLTARCQCVSRPDVICVQLYIELRTKGVRRWEYRKAISYIQ